ncbi:hypothetical protein L0B53_02575 [Vibrio sp. SS-MA-C1-2]|uniref:hypothetical protein n=1 Tax=Vibrio sp. SS-MA-C1-2 TaxID=2908646 RepID=UPI001F1EEFD4|nr:hypothetical protein [Vibrio sp. SS-MA-C1-2]UJF16851.1 hypothetical protein L0B53_02575 [Vibrio sp. SS-MA-C1-2]
MKVLIEFTETGYFREQVWEAPIFRVKGQTQAVIPSCASRLINEHQAILSTDDDEDIHLIF